MPTGYTCIIEDNPKTTFRDYALRCARAFGACIMQRDDDMNEPPKLREPSDYHEKELAKAKRELIEAEALSGAGLRALFDAEVARVRKENERYRREHEEKASRYAAMRAQVGAWQPPTPKHEEYKKFMLQQIDVSHRAGDTPYQIKEPASPEEYRRALVENARWSMTYHAKNHADEIARANDGAEWLQALFDSLPEAP